MCSPTHHQPSQVFFRVNLTSLGRLLAQPAFLGVSGSILLHGAVAGLIIYLLLALPQIWEVNVRRGEAVFIQAQMATIASTLPDPRTELEVSLEAVQLEPPPRLAVEHAPVRDTLEPVAVSMPVVKRGEYEPTDIPPQNKPPETTQQLAAEAQVPPRKNPATEPLPKPAEVASTAPPRQVADRAVIAESNISVAAIAPALAGAQVDELPTLLPFNPEPYYPLDALNAGREGRVVLIVLISPEGRASNIRVATSSGTPSLDASAIATVREWQFGPAKRKGVAVLHEALVPVNFRIRRS
jgi:periplasmic protein TonB